MRLGVPFIAPRQLGAVGGNFGRQILPSVGWRTGQSGAPPDSPCSCRCAISFLFWRIRPLQICGSWHTRQSGAHRTVRCPLPTVGAPTRRARIARPTVGAVNRWLTGQSGASSDQIRGIDGLFPFKCGLASNAGLRHLSWNNSGSSATMRGRANGQMGAPDCPVCTG